MQGIVETARLVLRPVYSLEAAGLHVLFMNEAVCRYLTDGIAMSREWVEGVIRDSKTSFTERDLGLHFVLSRDEWQSSH